MDKIIEKIIEADEIAAKLVDDTQNDRITAQQEITAAKTAIYNKYIEEANVRIEKCRAEEQEKAEKTRLIIKKRYDKQIAQLDEVFKKNSSRWVKDIVANTLNNFK